MVLLPVHPSNVLDRDLTAGDDKLMTDSLLKTRQTGSDQNITKEQSYMCFAWIIPAHK